MSDKQLAILQGMLKEAALAGRQDAAAIVDETIGVQSRVIDVTPKTIDVDLVKSASAGIDKAAKCGKPHNPGPHKKKKKKKTKGKKRMKYSALAEGAALLKQALPTPAVEEKAAKFPYGLGMLLGGGTGGLAGYGAGSAFADPLKLTGEQKKGLGIMGGSLGVMPGMILGQALENLLRHGSTANLEAATALKEHRARKKEGESEKEEKKKEPKEKEAAFTNHLAQLFKASGTMVAAQDTKKKEKQKDTKREVIHLESASDTKPKKAPEKKPEPECSENKNEYTKSAGPRGVTGVMQKAKPLLEMLATLQRRTGPKLKELGGRALSGLAAVGGKEIPAWTAALPAVGAAGGLAAAWPRAEKPDTGPTGSEVSRGIKRRREGKAKQEGEAKGQKAVTESLERYKSQQAPPRLAEPGEYETEEAYGPSTAEPTRGKDEQPGRAPAEEGRAAQQRAQAESRGKGGSPAEAGVTPGQQDLISAIRGGLGRFGGATMGTVGSALGGLGLPGAEEWLARQAESPGTRELVGGGTAAAGTALAAYLISKLLGGGGGDKYASLYADPYKAGFALGMAKASTEAMGRPAAPPLVHKEEQIKELTPRRYGVTGSARQEIQQRLDALTR